MKIRILLFIVVIVSMVSCGPNQKLQHRYQGKSVDILKENFGEPKTVLDQKDGKVYVYEKVRQLESTEINQGKLALDAMVTPKAEKRELYYFTVRDGVVVDTRYEIQYQKKEEQKN